MSDGRGKNANSLANLKKGGAVRKKPRTSTKNYVLDIADILQADLEKMFREINSLPVKERLKMKLEVMKLVIPKIREVTSTSTTTENKVDWSIKLAADQPITIDTDATVVDKNDDDE